MKTYRNKKYLQWVASHPCLVCGRTPCAPHHESITGRGIGLKPPDTETVPLCVGCHQARHDLGRLTFWDRKLAYRDFDVAAQMIRLLTEWMQKERGGR